MSVRTSLVIWLAAAGIWTQIARGQDRASVEIQTVEVTPGLYMLVGQGGNIGVSAGEDGLLMIDDQFAPLAPKIRAALEAIRPGAVRFLLNTHWHGDHTGGNEVFGRAGSVIVAHDAVRERMSTRQVQESRGRVTPPAPAVALPVVTYANAVTLHFNGETLRVHHMPFAHTDGDSIVHFERADALHLGDIFFSGRYPFIDLDSGGSLDGLIAAVDRGLALAGPDTKIIPGHGPLSTREDLTAYRAMLADVRDRANKARADGASLEDWMRSSPTADLDARWAPAGGFMQPEAFQRIVWNSLEAAP
jgi:glyoxylase-like metal-dependent hydrolase (beta-lactamase superfamily II)